MDNLSLAVELHGREVVIRMAGTLDVSSSGCLRIALDGLLDLPPTRVVLDLSRVSFLDSHAIGVIVGACKALRRRGGNLVLRDPQGPVALVLRTVGLQRAIEIELSAAA